MLNVNNLPQVGSRIALMYGCGRSEVALVLSVVQGAEAPYAEVKTDAARLVRLSVSIPSGVVAWHRLH